jgi:TrmH family RNA methyltransferase
MITVRKLLSLPWKTRVRKIARVLSEVEEELHRGASKTRPSDLKPIITLLAEDAFLSAEIRQYASELADALTRDPLSAHIRTVNIVRHRLFSFLGHEPADWDVRHRETGQLDRSARTILDMYVYLEDLRAPFNVGAIFRTAESFGIRKILLSPECPSPDHSRARRSAMGANEVIEWEVCEFEQAVESTAAEVGAAPGELPVFAVETGGTPIESFAFPRAGLMVLGSEELGVSGHLLKAAEARAGRVTIPQAGSKASLNVGIAFGIVAHAWFIALR